MPPTLRKESPTHRTQVHWWFAGVAAGYGQHDGGVGAVADDGEQRVDVVQRVHNSRSACVRVRVDQQVHEEGQELVRADGQDLDRPFW